MSMTIPELKLFTILDKVYVNNWAIKDLETFLVRNLPRNKYIIWQLLCNFYHAVTLAVIGQYTANHSIKGQGLLGLSGVS